MVSGTGIEVKHGRRTVLDNVDIEIHRNELVTLIGPNGSGKTTLVRVLLGLEKPGKGSVASAADLRVGYTPQLLTVDRTLPLDVQRFLAMSGISDTEILQETLTSVGASAIFNQEIRLLSGGELKRVMLARALLREPDLLVLDEPTANVDVRTDRILRTDTKNTRRTRLRHARVPRSSPCDVGNRPRGLSERHVCCSGLPDAVSRIRPI